MKPNPQPTIDHLRKKRLFSARMTVVVLCIICLILLLVARLTWLQIAEHPRYTTLSEHNRLTLFPLEPARGRIFDKNGVLLAENVPVYSLEVTPGEAKNIKQTITALTPLVNLTPTDIDAFYHEAHTRRRFASIPLKVSLTAEEMAKFYLNQYRFKGVQVRARFIRHYPKGALFGHIVGYVGRINQSELASVDASNYAATNYIGKTGVEKYYESELHGTVGYQQVETDAAGKVVRVIREVPPTAGDDVYLSVDSGLQQAALSAMTGYNGAVVALDPRTGAILAMVSTPTFDPDPFVTGMSAKDYTDLQTDPNNPLFDRAIRGLYPPGSTVKPFYGLQALTENIITPETTIHDQGWFQIAGTSHIYHDWKPGGHGWVDLTKAIVESVDTYFYWLADQMGIEPIDKVLNAFGFGQPTGIDLPNERAGLVPSPDWKWKTRGKHWYPGDTLIMGIGQGALLVTPLQLAVATATLAEQGHAFQPSLLDRRVAPDGLVTEQNPIPAPSPHFSAENWSVVERAMEQVVTAPSGTGYHYGKVDYHIAGKTGTAQVISRSVNQSLTDVPLALRAHSWFIGFAPLPHPTIAVAVIVEHDSHAAVVVARKVVDAWLALQKDHQMERKHAV